MPLTNIIDRREHPNRWKHVSASLYPASQDNDLADTDRATPVQRVSLINTPPPQRSDLSLWQAIEWARRHSGSMTLVIYDQGKGPA